MQLLQNLSVGIVSPAQMLANFLVAVVFSLLIGLVYKKIHRGVSYSRGFVLSLVMVGVVMAGVMMVIGNSLARAFGLFGAFSLVRFRSAIKDPHDIAFVFWSLINGMAAGTANYELALFLFIVMAALAYFLEKYQFGAMKKTGFTAALVFKKTARKKEISAIEKIFKDYCKNYVLVNQRKSLDKKEEWIYSLVLDKAYTIEQLIVRLKGKAGVDEVKIYNNAVMVEV